MLLLQFQDYRTQSVQNWIWTRRALRRMANPEHGEPPVAAFETLFRGEFRHGRGAWHAAHQKYPRQPGFGQTWKLVRLSTLASSPIHRVFRDVLRRPG